ncbi:MAG: FtsX-like permease family protein [Phycisphaerales bacterium]|nr:FtsX-like permease family protein [Phycisphaerales bacterium]
MYQALITRRYLTSKVMPLLASLAVVLCTAMVLITWSVMGGFLNSLLSTGRTMIGDVTINWPNRGFAHYDDLVARLEADPMIAAAAPVIETAGTLTLPDDRVELVLVKGVDPESFARVTRYAETIWWKPLAEPMPKDGEREDIRLNPSFQFDDGVGNRRVDWNEVERQGLTLSRVDPETGAPEPALVMGLNVSELNRRKIWGGYVPTYPQRQLADGSVEDVPAFLPVNGEVILSVAPFDSKGRVVDMVTRSIPVANEFNTGVWDVDSRTVLVRLDLLQQMLGMDRARRVEQGDPREAFAPYWDEAAQRWVFTPPDVVVEDPPRVTSVLVRAHDPDLDPEVLKAQCRIIYGGFVAAHAGEVPVASRIRVNSWADLNRVMIAAVKKETSLVLFIFSFISLTAVFLVLAIFWSMVSERTREIGVLRALGASGLGVASLWLSYGLVIGFVGSALGLALAFVIVHNINPIHEWLGSALGIVIWDPAIYVFTRIPSEVDPVHAAMVFVAGVVSCVVGALIPAVRAARMDPVAALRFE